MPIEIGHLLASSALPFIFPPTHINREYFGDGSMRQIAPLSPALHLGAGRLLVIGVGRQLQPNAERMQSSAFPTLAQIAGHALNSIFLDSLEVDLERLQRINRTIELIPQAVRRQTGYPLHKIEFRVITPSEELEKIAADHAHELPKTIRTLLSTVGGTRRSGSNLLSYLFVREIILSRADQAGLQGHHGPPGRSARVSQPAGTQRMKQPKPFSDACERNRDPILDVLRTAFAGVRDVLEIGSGTGQHAVHFARHLPHLVWHASDVAEHHAGIQAWIDESGLANVRAPLALDVRDTCRGRS